MAIGGECHSGSRNTPSPEWSFAGGKVRGETRAPIANRGAITFSIMLANIMQGLDTTIANVALPHIQGSLSASQDQISWVLTSYIVASIQISVEPNQSLSSPRSSSICNAPIARLKVAKPMKSNGSRCP